MNLDLLFGSKLAGRALLVIRALSGADVDEIADLLAERRRPAVRRALRRFVDLGVLRTAPRAGLRRPYVLSPDWPSASALARLLDLHLDAQPEFRRRADLSRRLPGGQRGPRAPVLVRDRTPRGLHAAPVFGPFVPPAQAKVVTLLARHGPLGTMSIATALGIGRGSALRLGAVLVQRGLAATAVAPFAKGVERWYMLTPAGAIVGGYLAAVVGQVRGPRRGGTPPTFPTCPPQPWRECVAVEGTPQRTALRILDVLASGPLDVDRIAHAVQSHGRRVRPHLDALVQAGILRVEAPASVPTYSYESTPQGATALRLFSS
jgi:DNA-binding IclR family transcriptional regulator